jgi:hypothetical protein
MSNASRWPGSDRPARYQIKVYGQLGEKWSDWFDGLAITIEKAAGSPPVTSLNGLVVDQARLRGILSKIWDLNLTVISVIRIEPREGRLHPQQGGERNGKTLENGVD